MVRWCWVNFQCRGVLLIWIGVGQGPTALAVGAGGGCLDIFTLIYPFFLLSPSLWETAPYRLKYCLKGPLSPRQPTNQPHPTSHPQYRKGKRTHTKFDKRSRKTCTVNRMSSSFPNRWSFSYHNFKQQQ